MPSGKAKQAAAEDPTAHLEQRINGLEAIISKQHEQMEKLMMLLQGQQAQAQEPAAPAPAEAFTRDEADPDLFAEENYWVRLKPYEPKLRQVRRRMLVPELGRPINGGTGKIDDIPEWMRVDRERAMELTKYLQFPEDPYSPQCFDIVTDEERERIDALESNQRLHALGVAGMTPQQLIAEQEKLGRVRAKERKVRRQRPAMVAGAQRFRGDALKGLTPPPPPPGSTERAPSAPPPGREPRARQHKPGAEDLSRAAARVDVDAAAEELANEAMGTLQAK